MKTADHYINRVLGLLPPATPLRTQIAMELRGHIEERVSRGHSVEEVLGLLGDPASLAESYLSAVPLVSVPFGPRAVAKGIDVLAVVLAVAPVAWLLSSLVVWEMVPAIVIWVVLVGGSLLFAPYTIVSEWAWGQTLGKRLLDMRVVRESGTRIGFGQAIVRQLPMFFQVYLLDALFALFTANGQRAFELLSKTRVVRARADA
jgi:uncharacterized RDD family membrane protein YckC